MLSRVCGGGCRNTALHSGRWVTLRSPMASSTRSFSPANPSNGRTSSRAAPCLLSCWACRLSSCSPGITVSKRQSALRAANWRVVGRTSAFQFKGQNKDLTAIGQALHATHLIEDSVRKDGNEVRITAQLIRADNGTHLWTESYDRELRGVFAVQEEIAQKKRP